MHHSRATEPSLDASFLKLLSQHEPVVRAYLRSLVPTAADVDELMPEVALVPWRKFSTLADPAAYPQWACVIARYEVLRWRRDKARDRLVLDEDVIAKLADEAETSVPLTEGRMMALEGCLQKLPPDRRDLVLACHTPGVTTREVARRTGRSEDALYQIVRRLRLQLHHCIDSTLIREETP
jgi:RNA polymerase sigma-70 factor (ECF subfamily)